MHTTSPTRRLVLACCSIALALASGSSCGKNAKQTHPARLAPATDALWALAPASTRIGLVVAPGTGPLLEAARAEVERSLSRWPNVQAWLAEQRSKLPAEVFDAAARTRMGLDVSRGAALFLLADDELVLVLPVVDRAAFRQRTGATTTDANGVAVDTVGDARCQEVAGHYACSNSASALALVGKSDALARRVSSRPAGLRGAVELELEIRGEVDARLAEIFSRTTAIQSAVQLAPGVITVRGFFGGTMTQQAQSMFRIPQTLARRVAESRPGGFVRFNALWRDALVAAPEVIGLDIDASDLSVLTGEMVLASAAGDVLDLSVQMGATDGKRLQPAVAQLCQKAQDAGLPIPVRMEGERCTARIEPSFLALAGLPPSMTFERPLEIALSTSDTAVTLRVTMAGQTAGRGVEMTAIGQKLLTEPWSLVAWSHGTMLRRLQAAPMLRPTALATALAPDGNEQVSEVVSAALWWLSHLSEFAWGAAFREDGFHTVLHVGTHWANPDDVLRAYQALLDRMLAGADIEADLTKLARAQPATPLGRAYESGPGGFVIAAAVVGTMTAVTISAFERYMQRVRATEAEQFTRKMSDASFEVTGTVTPDGQVQSSEIRRIDWNE